MSLTDEQDINPELFYNSIYNLKKAGVEVQLSAEQATELAKCEEDIEYFISQYVKISSLDEGTILFKPHAYQTRAIRKAVENRFNIWKWPRQQGKTTTVAAILLWYAVFNEKFDIAIVAQQKGQAVEILDRIREMYENLPWWMQPGVFSWNKGSIRLGNKTKVFTAATGGSGVRGKSINILYMDEFAWVQDDVTFYTATYPVVSSGATSKIIITSTPNGMNLFYKLWTEATTGKNTYAWDESFWHEHPKRDAAWKKEQLDNMSERQFDQEFDTKFYGSSDTLISGNKLQQMTFREPKKILNDNRDLKIFEDPRQDRSYAITVDVSEGVGKDYSVMSVIDVTEAPFEQVAMMRSNIMSPLILADLVNRYGILYNNAVVIVESNTYGKQTVDSLWFDYEYDNMLITQQHQQESKVASGGRKSSPGIKTTKKSKMLGCSSLKGLIESNQLIIHDFDTVQELTTFVKKGPSYEAEKGKYDDIAMTLVIFAWFTAQPYFQDMVDLNVRQLVRENLTQNEEYSTAFGFMDDGLSNVEEDISVELFLSLRKN